MKNIAAILVLAFAVAGCGSSAPGWQDEVREDARRAVEEEDPEKLRQECEFLEQDGAKEALIFRGFEGMKPWGDSARNGDSRMLGEILADHGVAYTPEILREFVEITVEERERSCHGSLELSWGSSEPSWQDEVREDRRSHTEALDPADGYQACKYLEEDGAREATVFDILKVWEPLGESAEVVPNGRTVGEILADHGVTYTPEILREFVEITVEELERICPGILELSWQDEVREDARRAVEATDPEEMRRDCANLEQMGAEAIKSEMFELYEGIEGFEDLALFGDGRELNEILADYGVTFTPEILREWVEIFVDEGARICS